MNCNKTNIYFYVLILILTFFNFPSTALSAAKVIEPPDVYRAVDIVRSELEIIRNHMQKSSDPRASIPISEAQPREVYFQALTLLHKASRLCHDTTQYILAPPVILEDRIPENLEPKHVLEKVNQAWSQIGCAKSGLGIQSHVGEVAERDSTKTPSDVLKSIVLANRQINLLLNSPIAPGDVIAVVRHANVYTTDILDKLAQVWKVNTPSLPEFQEGKEPIDVYKQMLKNFKIIEQIANTSGINILHLGSEIQTPIAPTDVFDLSSLLVSELRYFATLVGINRMYRLEFETEKTPSDVFQQAQLLEQHLKILENLAKTYPNWTEID